MLNLDDKKPANAGYGDDMSLGLNVTFKFKLNDVVVNMLGGVGVISLAGVDSSGNRYFIQNREGEGSWWQEYQLTAAE